MTYLEPSPDMRELQLLELLMERPKTSQVALARAVGLAPARVNAYIRRFVEHEYLATEKRSQGVAYLVTPKGRHRLAYHQISYRAELVQLAGSAHERFADFFQGIVRQGMRGVVLYGAGETGEVMLDSLARFHVGALRVVALFDDDPKKQGTTCHGIPVLAPQPVRPLGADALIVTSISFSERIRARIMDAGGVDAPVFSVGE